MDVNDINIYQGLYGSHEIEFTKGLIHINPFGLIGKKFENIIEPHAHNRLFQIFLIQKGTTHLLFKNEKYIIQQPTIVTIPKNTIHGFEHKNEVGGWIISLSDTVLEHMIYRDASVVDTLEDAHIISIKEETLSEEIEKAIYKCVLEYKTEKPGRLLMLEYLVGQLIILLYRVPQNEKQKLNPVDHVSKIYFRRFTQAIKTSGSYKKTIDEYANELGITSGHLNKITQQVAAKSPKELIIDYFITEAQLLLSNVNLTISEVSYRLNFDDKSYFSRLFKKKTGKTPVEFRKMLGTKF